MEIQAHPPEALDSKTKRFVNKELRAAWGAKGANWLTPDNGIRATGPAFYISCQADLAATAIVLNLRISLAHLVAGIRTELPSWAVHFAAHGNDGVLQLMWGRDTSETDAVRSLVGRFLQDRPLPPLGTWTWNRPEQTWKPQAVQGS